MEGRFCAFPGGIPNGFNLGFQAAADECDDDDDDDDDDDRDELSISSMSYFVSE
jgi:hypothetical protein